MATQTWTATGQTGDATPENDASTTLRNFRHIISASVSTTSGTQVRIKIQAHSGVNTVIHGLTIGPRSDTTEVFASTPTKLKLGGAVISGTNIMTVLAGTTAYTDLTDFVFNEATDYLVHIFADDGLYDALWIAASGTHVYYNGTDSDESMDLNPVLGSSGPYVFGVHSIEVDTPAAWTPKVIMVM